MSPYNGLLIQTQKGRGIDLPFPLSVAYHVTLNICLFYSFESFSHQSFVVIIIYS